MAGIMIEKQKCGMYYVFETIGERKGRILFSSGNLQRCELFKQMAINEIQNCYDLDSLLFGIDDDMISETSAYFDNLLKEERIDDPDNTFAAWLTDGKHGGALEMLDKYRMPEEKSRRLDGMKGVLA